MNKILLSLIRHILTDFTSIGYIFHLPFCKMCRDKEQQRRDKK